MPSDMWVVDLEHEPDGNDVAAIFCAVRFHGEICGAPSAFKMIGGCVHEHIGLETNVCQRCADFVEQNDIICILCQRIDGHLCEITFETKELDV